MFFLFCSRTDVEAIWLYEQVTFNTLIDSAMLFAEDIYDCSNWHLRLNDHTSFAEVTLANGKKINSNNVTLFLNRVISINHPFWQKKDSEEQQYFHQEWNAFLLGWLKAFEPVLINKIFPASLTGFSTTPLHWNMLAHKAGFAIQQQTYTCNAESMAKLYTATVSPNAITLLVYNNKVYCDVASAGLSKFCVALADSCHCNLLQILVIKDAGNNYLFLNANSSPTFSSHPQNFVHIFKSNVLKAQYFSKEKQLASQTFPE